MDPSLHRNLFPDYESSPSSSRPQQSECDSPKTSYADESEYEFAEEEVYMTVDSDDSNYNTCAATSNGTTSIANKVVNEQSSNNVALAVSTCNADCQKQKSDNDAFVNSHFLKSNDKIEFENSHHSATPNIINPSFQNSNGEIVSGDYPEIAADLDLPKTYQEEETVSALKSSYCLSGGEVNSDCVSTQVKASDVDIVSRDCLKIETELCEISKKINSVKQKTEKSSGCNSNDSSVFLKQEPNFNSNKQSSFTIEKGVGSSFENLNANVVEANYLKVEPKPELLVLKDYQEISEQSLKEANFVIPNNDIVCQKHESNFHFNVDSLFSKANEKNVEGSSCNLTKDKSIKTTNMDVLSRNDPKIEPVVCMDYENTCEQSVKEAVIGLSNADTICQKDNADSGLYANSVFIKTNKKKDEGSSCSLAEEKSFETISTNVLSKIEPDACMNHEKKEEQSGKETVVGLSNSDLVCQNQAPDSGLNTSSSFSTVDDKSNKERQMLSNHENLNKEIREQKQVSCNNYSSNDNDFKKSSPVDLKPDFFSNHEKVLSSVDNDCTKNKEILNSNEKCKANKMKQKEHSEGIFRKFLKYQAPSSTLGPLPEGWEIFFHSSGMPCYFHRQSKSVTWSRPYSFLGDTRHIKRHQAPIFSIPCLNYEKVKEKALSVSSSSLHSQGVSESDETPKEEKNSQNKSIPTQDGESNNTSDLEKKQLPSTNTENRSNLPKAILHNSEQTLSSQEFGNYLEKKFEFDVREVKRLSNWAGKRKAAAQEKSQEQEAEANSITPGKVVTITVPRDASGSRLQQMSFNLSVKPMVGILHEYVQLALKSKPEYEFTVKEHSLDPFHLELKIDGKIYGRGSGASKKTAKNRAALEAMDNLVPGFREKVNRCTARSSTSLFDDVAVDDPRVYDLCVHSGDFLPYELLSECLKRNQPIVNVQETFEAKAGKGRLIEYAMQCGKHFITGTAKNKKEGRQYAAQRMLQLLHPQIKTWGELARRYGSEVSNKVKRKQALEQEILELKQRDASNRASKTGDALTNSNQQAGNSNSNRGNRDQLVANPQLLNKLRDMMMKLDEEKKNNSGPKAKKSKTSFDEEDKTNKLLVIDV